MKLFQNKMTALRNVVVAATMIVATTTTFAHVSLVSAILRKMHLSLVNQRT